MKADNRTLCCVFEITMFSIRRLCSQNPQHIAPFVYRRLVWQHLGSSSSNGFTHLKGDTLWALHPLHAKIMSFNVIINQCRYNAIANELNRGMARRCFTKSSVVVTWRRWIMMIGPNERRRRIFNIGLSENIELAEIKGKIGGWEGGKRLLAKLYLKFSSKRKRYR